MAMDGKTFRKKMFEARVDNAMKTSTRGSGSESDDGKELGDDDKPEKIHS